MYTVYHFRFADLYKINNLAFQSTVTVTHRISTHIIDTKSAQDKVCTYFTIPKCDGIVGQNTKQQTFSVAADVDQL